MLGVPETGIGNVGPDPIMVASHVANEIIIGAYRSSQVCWCERFPNFLQRSSFAHGQVLAKPSLSALPTSRTSRWHLVRLSSLVHDKAEHADPGRPFCSRVLLGASGGRGGFGGGRGGGRGGGGGRGAPRGRGGPPGRGGGGGGGRGTSVFSLMLAPVSVLHVCKTTRPAGLAF